MRSSSDFDTVVSHRARFETPAKLSDHFTHVHINVNMFCVCVSACVRMRVKRAKKVGSKHMQGTFRNYVPRPETEPETETERTRARATTRAHMPRPGESVTAQNK